MLIQSKLLLIFYDNNSITTVYGGSYVLLLLVLPARLEFFLPVDPGLALGVDVVLVYHVFVGEGSLHLADVVVNLLPSVLVDRGTDRPDHTELEPQLHHPCEVLAVMRIHLQSKY